MLLCNVYGWVSLRLMIFALGLLSVCTNIRVLKVSLFIFGKFFSINFVILFHDFQQEAHNAHKYSKTIRMLLPSFNLYQLL